MRLFLSNLITKADAEIARGKHRIAVERHALHAFGSHLERYCKHGRWVERHHDAKLPAGHHAYRRGPEPQRQQAIECGRAPAPLEVSENYRSGLLVRSFLYPLGYLFGDILAVSERDIMWIYGGGVVILAVTAWIWRPLLAISVHEELARAEGVNTARASAVFMMLLAFTVALAMKLVGILLIASLLVIPAAAARPFSSTPEQMAVIAAGLAASSVCGGMAASLWLDTPAGPTIVMVLALIFLLSFLRGSLRAAS